jgi:hypothetical protein
MARFADVHMRVDHPGQEHHVLPEFQGVPAAQPAVRQRLDRDDAAIDHADGQRALGLVGITGDRAASPDEQVGVYGHDLDIKL